MDPNETLIALLQRLADGDHDGAIASCEALAGWLDASGAVPQATAQRALQAMKVCEALDEYAHNFYEEIPEDLAAIVTDARAALGEPEAASPPED